MKPEPALILIDIQEGLDEKGYYGSERNNPEAENNCATILQFFRAKSWPVFHVKHDSVNPNSPLHPTKSGNQIKKIVAPEAGEPVFGKNVNSAFIGTDLEKTLKSRAVEKVIIVGLTAEHCVSTSTRMSANLGFDTILIADATAAFDKVGLDGKTFSAQQVFDITIANLNEEFATIYTTESLKSYLNSTY